MPELANEVGMLNSPARLGVQAIIDVKEEEERAYEEASQRSYFLNFGDINKPILGDGNSIIILHASNKLVNI